MPSNMSPIGAMNQKQTSFSPVMNLACSQCGDEAHSVSTFSNDHQGGLSWIRHCNRSHPRASMEHAIGSLQDQYSDFSRCLFCGYLVLNKSRSRISHQKACQGNLMRKKCTEDNMHESWIISLKSIEDNSIFKDTKQAGNGKEREKPRNETPPLLSPNASKSRPLTKRKVSTGVPLTASNDSIVKKLSKARKSTLRSAAVKTSSPTKEKQNSSPESEPDSCHDQHTTDSSSDSDSARNDWHNAQNKDHSPYLSLNRLQDLSTPTGSAHEEIEAHLSEADTRQDKRTSEASLASDSARNEWHVRKHALVLALATPNADFLVNWLLLKTYSPYEIHYQMLRPLPSLPAQ